MTNRGGRRRNAGAPRRRITLSQEDARTLKLLVVQQRGVRGEQVSEEEILHKLLQAKWEEIDAAHQRAAEIAHEPYIF